MKTLMIVLVVLISAQVSYGYGSSNTKKVNCYTERCNPYSKYQNPYSKYQNPYSSKYIPNCKLTGACR